MSRVVFIVFCLVAFINYPATGQSTYIQIEAEPNISVFINGVFKGKTIKDLNGLVIEGVIPGVNVLKVVKEGFQPQELKIQIKSGEVFLYKVKPFLPTIGITQKGNEESQVLRYKTGKIKVQSVPIGITIKVPQIGINSIKTEDQWFANEIPIGDYEMTFSLGSKVLKYKTTIKDNRQVYLFADLLKNEVRDLSIDKIGILSDARDNKRYRLISIGDQVWMAENLDTERFRNGDIIPHANSVQDWIDFYLSGKPAWCYYNINHDLFNKGDLKKHRELSNTYKKNYAKLYNWFAVNDPRGLAPEGFHIPSKDDWDIFANLLGAENAGKKIKSRDGWIVNGSGTDSIGFDALPGGHRDVNGFCGGLGGEAYFWSSTDKYNGSPRYDAVYYFSLYHAYKTLKNYTTSKGTGYSVRCIMD